MAEEREDDELDADVEAAKAVGAAKKKKLILLAGLAVVLLALAGGGTWFVLSMAGDKKPEAAEAEAGAEHGKEEHAAEEPGGAKKASFYESLDPAFLANYLVGGRQHYLQLSLSVMAREQEGIDGVHVHMPLIRNRVVMILSGETFEGLQSEEGRVQLQQKLLAAIQEILQKETGKPGIEQVFFTNFVMQ
jgi:flagellar FliL protein